MLCVGFALFADCSTHIAKIRENGSIILPFFFINFFIQILNIISQILFDMKLKFLFLCLFIIITLAGKSLQEE